MYVGLKQLGICVLYINSCGNVTVRIFKILEVTQGTADVLTDTIVNYLTQTALVPLHLTKLLVAHLMGLVSCLELIVVW